MGRSWARRQVRQLRWRCTGNSPAPNLGPYDPALFRLVPAEPCFTLQQLAAAADPTGTWRPASGLIWSRHEFLDLPWVSDWVADWDDGELYCATILDRYGDYIPADLAVLEAVAADFQGIETFGHEASFVHESHVNGFAEIDDLHLALLALYRDDWIIPLDDGTLASPKLILAPTDLRRAFPSGRHEP